MTGKAIGKMAGKAADKKTDKTTGKATADTAERIAIVGLGRFGAMWATLLARHAAGRYEVVAYNRTPLPPQHPIAAHPAIEIIEFSALSRATLIFICTAIASLPQILAALAPIVAPGAIVCDTCSVKETPRRWMRALLPRGCALLGTHPMFGPDSLSAAARLPIVYCPIRIPPPALARCVELFALWNLHAVEMTARQHDKISAYNQGFTHLIGRIAQQMRLSSTDIATLGYRKLLQVMEQTCRDSWGLFVDLQYYNRYTPRMLAEFSAALADIRKKIASGNSKRGLRTPRTKTRRRFR